jgi:hypothetical protein
MVVNDEPNCQVSSILMNPRHIYVKRLENDSITIYELRYTQSLSFIALNIFRTLSILLL